MATDKEVLETAADNAAYILKLEAANMALEEMVVQQEKRIAQLEADEDFLLKAFRAYWRGSPKDTGSDAPNR